MLSRRAPGFTIVELLVGLVVGLLVVMAAGAIYVTSVQAKAESLRGARLNQEVRGLLAGMAPDIRRAGYWGAAVSGGSAAALASSSGASHPFMGASSNLAIHDDGQCVLFSYDADRSGDGAVPASEVFGYRLAPAGGAVEMLTPGTLSATNAGCEAGDWSPLTTADTAVIEALGFSTVGSQCINTTRASSWTVIAPAYRGPPCTAAAGEVAVSTGAYAVPVALDLLAEVRRVTITVRARHRADPRVAVTVEEALRLPNNRVYRR